MKYSKKFRNEFNDILKTTKNILERIIKIGINFE